MGYIARLGLPVVSDHHVQAHSKAHAFRNKVCICLKDHFPAFEATMSRLNVLFFLFRLEGILKWISIEGKSWGCKNRINITRNNASDTVHRFSNLHFISNI